MSAPRKHVIRPGTLEAIVQAASRRRSRPVVILDKLEQRCKALAAQDADDVQAEPTSVDEELEKKVDALGRADALDSETLLTELLLNRKSGFLSYITDYGARPKHPKLPPGPRRSRARRQRPRQRRLLSPGQRQPRLPSQRQPHPLSRQRPPPLQRAPSRSPRSRRRLTKRTKKPRISPRSSS